jgi:seipin
MIILGLLLTYTPLGRMVKTWSAKRLWSILYVLLWLLGIQLTLLFAAIAYVALYQFYIPVNSLSLPLDFDFSTEDGAYAVAKLHGDVVSLNYVEPATHALWKYVPFVSTPSPAPEAPHNRVTTFGRPRDRIKTLRFMNMPYSVYVNLDLPETDRNLGTGNFMIRVSFADDLEVFRSTHRLTRDNRKRWPLTHNEEYAVRPNVGSINKREKRDRAEKLHKEDRIITDHQPEHHPLPALFTATRPAILAFQSATMRVMDTLLFAPLYLTGWKKQEQRLHVYMASNWHVPADVEDHEFAYAIVELDRTVDIYGAQIEWRVEWTGLRYFMYHHRVLAFLLGTAVLWYLEIFYLAIAYWSGKKMILKLTGDTTRTSQRPQTRIGGAGAGGPGEHGRPGSRTARIADDAALDADDPAEETDTPDRSELHTRSSEIQQLLEDSETTAGDSTIGDTTDNASVASQDEFSVEEDEHESVSLSASDSNVEGYSERQSSRIEICAGDSDDNSQTIRYPVSWPTPPPEGPLALSRQELESFTRYRYDQETPEILSRENTDSLSESDEFDFETQLQIDLRSLVAQNRQERQERLERLERLEELQAGPSGTTGRRTPDQRPNSAPQRFSPRPPRSPAISAHSSRGSLRSSRLSTSTTTGSNPSSTISRQRHVTPLTTPLPAPPDESQRDDGDDESFE